MYGRLNFVPAFRTCRFQDSRPILSHLIPSRPISFRLVEASIPSHLVFVSPRLLTFFISCRLFLVFESYPSRPVPSRCACRLARRGCLPAPSSGDAAVEQPLPIQVFVVERQVLTFTGAAESEEHYAFHSIYRKTDKGLSIYLTKEHRNQAAGVLWCYLK